MRKIFLLLLVFWLVAAGDDPIPNSMDVIGEFIRLLLTMMNPAKYNVEI